MNDQPAPVADQHQVDRPEIEPNETNANRKSSRIKRGDNRCVRHDHPNKKSLKNLSNALRIEKVTERRGCFARKDTRAVKAANGLV